MTKHSVLTVLDLSPVLNTVELNILLQRLNT